MAAVFTATAYWGISGSNSLKQTLNIAFGEGNWDHYDGYDGLDPDDLFGGTYGYVYLDGSDDQANEFNTFLAENRARIEQWVSRGEFVFKCRS